MTLAKASRRVDGTEAAHWPVATLDPSMILLNAVAEILAVPVADIRTKLASNRTRVTVMPIGNHPGRSDASHRFGRSKEFLCRGHIAVDNVALAHWVGVEHLIELLGQLYLFRTRADYENDCLGKELRDATGLPYEVIDNDAIRDLEPDLASRSTKRHCVSRGTASATIRTSSPPHWPKPPIQEGTEFLRADVNGLERSDRTVSALKTDRGRRGVSAVVVAAGAWSKPLVRLLVMTSRWKASAAITSLSATQCLPPAISVCFRIGSSRPRRWRWAFIAGTVEFAGNASRRCFGLFAKSFRASTLTNIPNRWVITRQPAMIGRSPLVSKVFFAFGHGFFGLIGAATTGQIVADLVTGRAPPIDLTPYRSGRLNETGRREVDEDMIFAAVSQQRAIEDDARCQSARARRNRERRPTNPAGGSAPADARLQDIDTGAPVHSERERGSVWDES